MSGDIQRLFSVIKQTDLPYRVFEDGQSGVGGVAPVPASTLPSEPPAIERRLPVVEDVMSAHAGLFRAYNAEAALSTSSERPLADIFRRMAKAHTAR